MNKYGVRINQYNMVPTYVCECGNNELTQGWETCDKDGNVVEPTDDKWNGHYICNNCDKIECINKEREEK